MKEFHMCEDTMEALKEAESYFCAVLEQESDGKVVPSRTEEIHWAVEGLEGIAFIRYKRWLKMHGDHASHNPHGHHAHHGHRSTHDGHNPGYSTVK